MIKVALAVGAGTGGALTLVLARRRQWASEHDAAERRLTELYVKAVEQLGSEQAAIRHGGLYALERAAQGNPDHRQTVVDVICAYLRTPYTTLPNNSSTPRPGVHRPLLKSPERRIASRIALRDEPTWPHLTAAENQRLQEREVRLTAQRILTRHLRPHNDHDEPLDTYWSDIDLDLTGATLIDFNLRACKIGTSNFGGAQFSGVAWFDGAQFSGEARFDGAQFIDEARFDGAQFIDEARFDGAQFSGVAWFGGVQFIDDARFGGAQFSGVAWFGGAQFSGIAWFDGAQFTSEARFDGAQFTGDAWFDGAQFTSEARFDGAQFTDEARFDDAQFSGDARFDGAQFSGDARFDGAQFPGDATFDGAQFTGDATFERVTFGRGIPSALTTQLSSAPSTSRADEGTR